jgi:long-chain acyl-CoA synthetase
VIYHFEETVFSYKEQLKSSIECREEYLLMLEHSQLENVLTQIKYLAVQYPKRIALIDENRRITYGELMPEIINIQLLLEKAFHVKKGERVGILLENNIDCAIAFLAILRSGAIAVIINTKLAKPEVDFIVNDAEPVLILIGNNDFHSLVEGEIPVYLISPAERDTQIDTACLPCDCPAGFCDEECAVIMYTSGTTGRPKGALITHRNITCAVDCYVKDVGLTEKDSTIIMVPLFYVTGLIAQMMVFLSLGAKIVLLRRFDADLALQRICQYQITHLHSVATVYLSLVTSMDKNQKLNLTCIHQALCGGGPITDALIDKLKQYLPWLDFRRIYGLTESTSPGTVMPVDVRAMPDKSLSSGLPMRWMKVKVVDDDGREVGPNETGELLIKGENVIQSYWNNPEANAKSFLDGWLRTGDIAKIDADGYVYILDRKKDMIIRGGEKIFCSEVEGVLALYTGVQEVAVIGIPDPYYGEVVKAFIVPTENANLKIEDLLGFARTKLAKFKVPAEIEIIYELPRSSVGKILKSALPRNS